MSLVQYLVENFSPSRLTPRLYSLSSPLRRFNARRILRRSQNPGAQDSLRGPHGDTRCEDRPSTAVPHLHKFMYEYLAACPFLPTRHRVRAAHGKPKI